MEILKWLFIIILALFSLERISELISNKAEWDLKYEILYLAESLICIVSIFMIFKI